MESIIITPLPLDPNRPFPLFGAPLHQAEGFLPEGDRTPCAHCGADRGPRLGAGVVAVLGEAQPHTVDELIAAVERRRRVSGRRPGSGAACVTCIQARRVVVAIEKDIEVGHVSWETVTSGWTGSLYGHQVTRAELRGDPPTLLGLPVKKRAADGHDQEDLSPQALALSAQEIRVAGQDVEGDDVVARLRLSLDQIVAGDEATEYEDEGDGLISVRVQVPPELVLELLAAPSYPTWQDSTWLFCCQRPMIFVGNWGKQNFDESALDGDGRALLNAALGSERYGGWSALGPGRWNDNPDLGVFVFFCPVCVGVRGYYDPS